MTNTPLSDDVVEIVARAIAAEDNEEDYDAWEANPSELGRRVWYEYARAALEAARYGEPAWQPIETAPADTNVLLALPCGEVIVGYKALRAWVDLVDQRVEPTHWMPLPEPPRTLLSSIGASQP